MRLFFSLTLIAHVAMAHVYGASSSLSLTRVEVTAPFEMPAITIPDFSKCPRFVITDFGASPGDKLSTGAAIAWAMTRASQAGGGVVVIPAGEWLTGQIHFRSDVALHLEKDAVLLFSEDPTDYLPAVHTTWEGMECYNYSPLIYAYECENIAITGPGKLKAKLDVWERWYARPTAHLQAIARLYHAAAKGVPVPERQMAVEGANLRPHFIQFNRCKSVLLEDVSIEDSPFWVIHPYHSSDVVIRRVRVKARGHNNDGVDPDMSQNVLIEDCVFDQGDDAIAVKSGSNQDAWRLDRPSKNIVVRNCLVRNAHQLLAIGSEVSGGVENISVENCRLDKDIENVGHLLFIKTNDRRGGYVKNIHMKNVTAGALKFGILGIDTDVLYQWRDLVPNYETRLTPISEVHLNNVHADSGNFVSRISGAAALPVSSVRLVDVSLADLKEDPFQNIHVKDFVREE